MNLSQNAAVILLQVEGSRAPGRTRPLEADVSELQYKFCQLILSDHRQVFFG